MAKKRRKGGSRLRRIVQAASLGLFLFLLWMTVSPLPRFPLPPQSFLLLDPLVALGVPLAAREWIGDLIPGLVVLLSAFVVGRVFCGYICPMGTTLDLMRALMDRFEGRKREKEKAKNDPTPWMRHIKYLVLGGIAGGALLGVNLVFWAAPIPLITRFYALLMHPLLLLGGHEALAAGQPVFSMLDWQSLSYLQIEPRRYWGLLFIVVFFGALFFLERVRPRFWCRYLCPAGALLALASRFPLWRRRVAGCTGCDFCSRACPTNATAGDGGHTLHAECLACRDCVGACPVSGTRFAIGKIDGEVYSDSYEKRQEKKPKTGEREIAPLPTRRAFLASVGAGGALAAVELSNTGTLLEVGIRGTLWPYGCIRPPGAVPEPAFLDRCVRCGLCMKVCPTNALQPAGLSLGLDGVFSPVLVARRGACEPDCNACGHVCPTQALLPLPQEEKTWAKIGTAVVLKEMCLAWSEERHCLVCEEVCPYGAIEPVMGETAHVPVPKVNADRCYGCGYCEQHCPVRVPAIVIRPTGALRLDDPGYRERGQRMGLQLDASGREESSALPVPLPSDSLPPGFTD